MAKRPGHVASEPAEILFVTALGSGCDHPVRPGQDVNERGAAGACVNKNKRPVVRLEPMLEFLVRYVFANEVELGLLTIECAVAHQHDPNLVPLGFGPLFQLGLDGFSRAGFLRAVSDMHQFRCVALKRLGQSLGPLRKQFTVFLLATCLLYTSPSPRDRG